MYKQFGEPPLHDSQYEVASKRAMAVDEEIQRWEGELCADLGANEFSRVDAIMEEVMELMPQDFYRQLMMLWSGGTECVAPLRKMMDEAVQKRLEVMIEKELA